MYGNLLIAMSQMDSAAILLLLAVALVFVGVIVAAVSWVGAETPV